MKIVWLLMVFIVASPHCFAEEWNSGPLKTEVIELFTSEGCSSCPPADRWLSSLKHDPELFTEFIPIAFHVDYWDYIGWQDPFAKAEFSERQRQYVRAGHVSQAYTPGIVINSSEWRDWFRGARRWNNDDDYVGTLIARLDQDQNLQVSFNGEAANTLHIALLGMGLSTNVKAGENRGRELSHDFVVLKLLTAKGANHWKVPLQGVPDAGQERSAIAIWVTAEDSMQILQATGGYLD